MSEINACERDETCERGQHAADIPCGKACTCPLHDVSHVTDRVPRYVRGEPIGCPVHDLEGLAGKRRQAEQQARYGDLP